MSRERATPELTADERAQRERDAALRERNADPRHGSPLGRHGAEAPRGGAEPSALLDSPLRLDPNDQYYGIEAAKALISAAHRNNWGPVPGHHVDEERMLEVLADVVANGRLGQLRSGMVAMMADKDHGVTLEAFLRDQLGGADKSTALELTKGNLAAFAGWRILRDLDHGRFDDVMGMLQEARRAGYLNDINGSLEAITGKKQDNLLRVFERAAKEMHITGEEHDRLARYVYSNEPSVRAQLLIDSFENALNLKDKQSLTRFQANLSDLTAADRTAVDKLLPTLSLHHRGKEHMQSIQDMLDRLEDKTRLTAAERRDLEKPGKPAEAPVAHGERKPVNRLARQVEEMPDVPGAEQQRYAVEKGDTPLKIARRLGIDVHALMAANPGVEWNRMQYEGRRRTILELPGASKVVAENN